MPLKYNFTQGLGVGKNQHPFTVSTTKEKVENSQKSAQEIIDEIENNHPNINNKTGLSTIIGDRPIPDLKMTAKEAETYYKNDVIPNPYIDRDILDKTRAKNQGVLAKTGNMLAQAITNEVLIGTVKGFFDIFDAVRNIGNYENNDYANAISAELERWQEAVKEQFPIYQKQNDGGFHLGDYGWWMNGMVNTATTLSLMIPGLAVGKGISLIGKVGGVGANLGKATRAALKGMKVANVGRVYTAAKTGAEIATMAFISRTAENYQEARETYKNVLDTTKQKLNKFTPEERDNFLKINPQFEGLSNDEIAENIASSSANRTFANDYWMLLMDLPQFKSLTSIFKGAGIAAKGLSRNIIPSKSIAKANRRAIRQLVNKGIAEEKAETLSKSFGKKVLSNFKFENIGTNLKNLWTSTEGLMLSEGIEEGFQAIQSQRGEEYGELYFNPYLQRKSLGDYLRDESVWEQAFWGVMGGLLFQAGAKGFNRLENRIRAKIKEDSLSKDDIEALRAGEDAGRVANINSWFKTMEEYRDDMDKISRGINIYSPKKNNKNETIRDSNGNPVYNEASSAYDIERIKTLRTDDFFEDFVINAINNGNYDLLREFVSHKEFNEYFRESGIDIDEGLEGQFISKMDEIFDIYRDAYYGVIDNTDAYNDHLTRLAAADITHKRLDLENARRRIDGLNSIIDSEGLENKTYYEQKAKEEVIRYKLDKIDEAINTVHQNYKTNPIYSKQAYENELKNLNDQKVHLYNLLENTNNLFNFSNIKNSGLDYNSILVQAAQEYNRILEENNLLDSTDINKLSDTVKQSLYQKAALEVFASEIENDLPNANNAKDYYKKLYEQKEAMFKDIAVSKFNDAFKTIQNFVKKSINPTIAVEQLIKGTFAEDPSLSDKEIGILNDALELLRFGSEDRVFYTAALLALKEEEEAKRKKVKEAQEKDIIDDREIESSVVDESDKNVSANKAKNNDENQVSQQSSSTGVEEKARKPKVISEEDVEQFDKEETPVADKLEEEVAEQQGEYFRKKDIYQDADSNALRIAAECTQKLIFSEKDLWKNVIDEGANSSSYNKFMNLIIENMFTEYGVKVAIAEKYAIQGLRLHLDSTINRVSDLKNSKSLGYVSGSNLEEKITKAKALLNSIEKTLGVGEHSSEYAGLSEKEALSAENKNIEQVFENFVNTYNIGTEKDGKIDIYINDIFSSLQDLFDDNGWSYERLLYLYKDIGRYIETEYQNEDSKFNFYNVKLLDIGFDNFIKRLYSAKTQTVVTSPFMHFDNSLDREENRSAADLTEKQKFNIIQQARNKEVKIEYSYDDKGKAQSIHFVYGNTELGYIALVSASKDNTTLYADYDGQRIDIKLGKKNYLSKALSLYDNVLKDKVLYDILAEQFYKNNLSLFSDASIKNKLLYDKEYTQSERNDLVKNFFENETVKKFLDNNIKRYGNLEENWKNFQTICRALNNVLFYDLKKKDIYFTGDDRIRILKTKKGLKESINNYKGKIYENFTKTKQLQDRLDKEHSVTAILRGDSEGKIRFDETQVKQIKNIGLTRAIDKNPEEHLVIYYDGNKGISENGTVYMDIPGLGNNANSTGSMGLILGTNQGQTIVNKDGTIKHIPGANIALFTGSNLVNSKTSKSAGKLQKALIEYTTNLFNDYYKVVKDNTSTFNQKNEAFNKIYENLNDLFGNTETKLFSGFIVSKRKDNIIHIAWEESPGEYHNLITLFKYENVNFVNGKAIDENRTLSNDELAKRMVGGMQIDLGGENFYTLKNINTPKAKSVLDSAINFIANHMIFNRSRFAINAPKNKQGKHIYKENGAIVIKVGDFEETYNSYAQAVVNLNMFTTSQVGKLDYQYEYDDKLPDSFYLEISDKITPVSEEEREQAKGLEYYLDKNNISRGQSVSTESILENSGLSGEKLDAIIEFNNLLKDNNSHALLSETTVLGGTPVNKEGDLMDKAHGYWDGINVIITDLAIRNSKKEPSEYVLRLLIHENIHRLVEETRFFDGEIGAERIKGINEVYFLFKKQLASETGNNLTDKQKDFIKSLRDKFNKFAKRYEVKEDNTYNSDLANEFMAEVMSDVLLRNYLNSIVLRETVTVNKVEEKKTLLQKILDFICQLFNFSVSNNTLLAKFYNVLGNVEAVSEGDTSIISINVKEDSTAVTPVKDVDESDISSSESDTSSNLDNFFKELEEDIKGEERVDTGDSNYEDEYKPIGRGSIYDEYTSSEIIFSDLNKDSNVNLFNVTKTSDMDTYIQSVPDRYRSEIADSFENGEVEYLCQ